MQTMVYASLILLIQTYGKTLVHLKTESKKHILLRGDEEMGGKSTAVTRCSSKIQILVLHQKQLYGFS